MHVSSVMIVTQKMFGYCGRLRAVSLFVNRSTMFVEAVFKSTFSFVISYFPYFKLVTLRTLVILCNTLKKEGRVFRNIGQNISLYCVISLVNFRLLFNLLLIRSSTARGSRTSILLRWSLQKLTSYREPT